MLTVGTNVQNTKYICSTPKLFHKYVYVKLFEYTERKVQKLSKHKTVKVSNSETVKFEGYVNVSNVVSLADLLSVKLSEHTIKYVKQRLQEIVHNIVHGNLVSATIPVSECIKLHNQIVKYSFYISKVVTQNVYIDEHNTVNNFTKLLTNSEVSKLTKDTVIQSVKLHVHRNCLHITNKPLPNNIAELVLVTKEGELYGVCNFETLVTQLLSVCKCVNSQHTLFSKFVSYLKSIVCKVVNLQ